MSFSIWFFKVTALELCIEIFEADFAPKIFTFAICLDMYLEWYWVFDELSNLNSTVEWTRDEYLLAFLSVMILPLFICERTSTFWKLA